MAGSGGDRLEATENKTGSTRCGDGVVKPILKPHSLLRNATPLAAGKKKSVRFNLPEGYKEKPPGFVSPSRSRRRRKRKILASEASTSTNNILSSPLRKSRSPQEFNKLSAKVQRAVQHRLIVQSRRLSQAFSSPGNLPNPNDALSSKSRPNHRLRRSSSGGSFSASSDDVSWAGSPCPNPSTPQIIANLPKRRRQSRTRSQRLKLLLKQNKNNPHENQKAAAVDHPSDPTDDSNEALKGAASTAAPAVIVCSSASPYSTPSPPTKQSHAKAVQHSSVSKDLHAELRKLAGHRDRLLSEVEGLKFQFNQWQRQITGNVKKSEMSLKRQRSRLRSDLEAAKKRAVTAHKRSAALHSELKAAQKMRASDKKLIGDLENQLLQHSAAAGEAAASIPNQPASVDTLPATMSPAAEEPSTTREAAEATQQLLAASRAETARMAQKVEEMKAELDSQRSLHEKETARLEQKAAKATTEFLDLKSGTERQLSALKEANARLTADVAAARAWRDRLEGEKEEATRASAAAEQAARGRVEKLERELGQAKLNGIVDAGTIVALQQRLLRTQKACAKAEGEAAARNLRLREAGEEQAILREEIRALRREIRLQSINDAPSWQPELSVLPPLPSPSLAALSSQSGEGIEARKGLHECVPSSSSSSGAAAAAVSPELTKAAESKKAKGGGSSEDDSTHHSTLHDRTSSSSAVASSSPPPPSAAAAAAESGGPGAMGRQRTTIASTTGGSAPPSSSNEDPNINDSNSSSSNSNRIGGGLRAYRALPSRRRLSLMKTGRSRGAQIVRQARRRSTSSHRQQQQQQQQKKKPPTNDINAHPKNIAAVVVTEQHPKRRPAERRPPPPLQSNHPSSTTTSSSSSAANNDSKSSSSSSSNSSSRSSSRKNIEDKNDNSDAGDRYHQHHGMAINGQGRANTDDDDDDNNNNEGDAPATTSSRPPPPTTTGLDVASSSGGGPSPRGEESGELDEISQAVESIASFAKSISCSALLSLLGAASGDGASPREGGSEIEGIRKEEEEEEEGGGEGQGAPAVSLHTVAASPSPAVREGGERGGGEPAAVADLDFNFPELPGVLPKIDWEEFEGGGGGGGESASERRMEKGGEEEEEEESKMDIDEGGAAGRGNAGKEEDGMKPCD
eukprot:jgi/Bigna1/144541/aug1.88_g19249